MRATRRRHLVSEEEFLALPESTDKIELIDGEVFLSPAPTVLHQEVLLRIVLALRTWASRQGGPVFVGLSPLDVRFAPDRILQPDAFLILDRIPLDWKGPIDRVPDLCVEVLSHDRKYDRVTKRLVYGASGVREYWVVEQAGLIERWTGSNLDVSEEVTGTLETPLLPGFALEMANLFRT
jgi:Uma2 family endonuclease